MLLDHFPKINIGIGIIILICFFLPWVSIDCGNVSFITISGYELATGNISLDNQTLQQFREQLNREGQSGSSLDQAQHARPQLFLLVVILGGLGIITFSARMVSEFNRMRAFSIIGFSLFGLVILLFASLQNFGLAIPQDVGFLLKTPLQFGFYITTLSFIGAGLLSFLAIKASAEPTIDTVPIEIPLRTPPPLEREIEQLPVESDNNEFEIIEEKPLAEKTAPFAQRRTSQPGARTCPTCGVVVGKFQTKCMKCGSDLKPHSK